MRNGSVSPNAGEVNESRNNCAKHQREAPTLLAIRVVEEVIGPRRAVNKERDPARAGASSGLTPHSSGRKVRKMLTKPTWIVTLAVVVAALANGACSDKKEQAKKTLVPICERATESLENSEGMDSETFMLSLENALKACSGACDASDGKSCDRLDGHIEKLCGAMPDACNSFCKDASGSLKKYACKHGKNS